MSQTMTVAALGSLLFSGLVFGQQAGRGRQPSSLNSNPRMIAVEVFMIKRSVKSDAGIESRLTAGRSAVLAVVSELESKGELSSLDRIRLVSIENQAAIAQIGQRISLQSGASSATSSSSRSGVRRVTSHSNVGTLVSFTPRVDGERGVLMELNVEKSQLEPDRDAKVSTSTTQTTIRIAHGKSIIVSKMESAEGDAHSQLFVVATARVLSSEAAE